MSKSAEQPTLTDRRRERTEMLITLSAQRLTDERGLDGFTMDELAEAVGVSRRTLFNYFPSKIDAVLGPGLAADAEPLNEFRRGGPSGDLLDDMRSIGAAVLEDKGADVEEITRVRRLLRGDARLVKAVHDRLGEVAELLAEAILEREGADFDPYKARVLARMSMCIFDTAVAAFLADSSVRADQHYLRVFDITSELFSDPR